MVSEVQLSLNTYNLSKSVKEFGDSFVFDASTVWNDLPAEIQKSLSIVSFRDKLKSFLYIKAYHP